MNRCLYHCLMINTHLYVNELITNGSDLFLNTNMAKYEFYPHVLKRVSA